MDEAIITGPREGYEPVEEHLREAFYENGQWFLRLSESCVMQSCIWPDAPPADPNQRKTLLDSVVPSALRGLWVKQLLTEALDEETGEQERLRLSPEGTLVLCSEAADGHWRERKFEWDWCHSRWFLAQYSKFAPSNEETKTLLGCLMFDENGEVGDEIYRFKEGAGEVAEAKKKDAVYLYQLATAMGYGAILKHGPI